MTKSLCLQRYDKGGLKSLALAVNSKRNLYSSSHNRSNETQSIKYNLLSLFYNYYNSTRSVFRTMPPLDAIVHAAFVNIGKNNDKTTVWVKASQLLFITTNCVQERQMQSLRQNHCATHKPSKRTSVTLQTISITKWRRSTSERWNNWWDAGKATTIWDNNLKNQ